MPWVRFDDHFPVNRKVDGLSDTAFRLHVSAIFWCARNLTDGVVPEEDLDLVTARVRAPARFGTELVRRGLWHEAGTHCESPHCPPSGPDGWVIHDYWGFQPSKGKVLADRADNAERQKRFREGKASQEGNGVSNGVTAPVSNKPPSRPVIKEPKTLSPPDGWEEFWATYPPRKGSSKADAMRAFTKATSNGVTADDIITAAEAYATERTGQDQKYTAHASTWLNGKRWETHDNAEPDRALFPWER